MLLPWAPACIFASGGIRVCGIADLGHRCKACYFLFPLSMVTPTVSAPRTADGLFVKTHTYPACGEFIEHEFGCFFYHGFQ